MKILISGATGFIGQHVINRLLLEGHEIYALVRNQKNQLPKKINQIQFDQLSLIDGLFDVFINLAGENIAGQRWTKERKKALYDSRIELTDTVRENLRHRPRLVISMSAVGYYGIAINEIFDEESKPNAGFAHELCRDWESSANAFKLEETRVVIFRLGVVLGKGGALKVMRLPFQLGLGGPISNGCQWFSWVHINDVSNAIMNTIKDTRFNGTYNLVAPQQITQKHFAKSYASSLSRPAWIPTPKFVLDIALGEMATLLTHGPRIIPKKLNQQGFKFEFKEIGMALEDIQN